MHLEQMQQNETTSFASMVATRRPRSRKDGALVHASGAQENGDWRPLERAPVWTHLRRRMAGVKA